MSELERAAEVVHGPKLVGDEDNTDWFSILDLLRNIAYVLLLGRGCKKQPTPDDLHKYMTRQYGFIGRLRGLERERDDTIRTLVAKHWMGDVRRMPFVQASVLSAAKAGKFTPAMIRGVWSEMNTKDDWDAAP